MYVANFSIYQQLRFSDYVSKSESLYVLRSDSFISTLEYLQGVQIALNYRWFTFGRAISKGKELFA